MTPVHHARDPVAGGLRAEQFHERGPSLSYIQNDKLSDKSLLKSGQSLQTSDVSFDNTD